MFKRLLVETAIELFKAKGFDAVTITEIAEKTGIARRTFFLYFPAKEDLLIQWLDDEWDHATTALLTLHASKPPFEAFASALLELGAHFDLDRDRAMAITRITLENPTVFGREYANQFQWEALWATRLREVKKERQSLSLSYDIQAAAAFAVVAVTARRWVDDPKQQSFCWWLQRGFDEVRSINGAKLT
jgi:AcrR family transcriptional regulator